MDVLQGMLEALGDTIEQPALAEQDTTPDIIDDLPVVRNHLSNSTINCGCTRVKLTTNKSSNGCG
jgi:hypothetical protein